MPTTLMLYLRGERKNRDRFVRLMHANYSLRSTVLLRERRTLIALESAHADRLAACASLAESAGLAVSREERA